MANTDNQQSNPMISDSIEVDTQAQNILNNIATGIGGSVWWKFSGTRVTPVKLRELMDAAGLDASRVKDIDPEQVLRQCVSDYKAWEKVEVAAGFAADGTKINKLVKKRVRADLIHRGDTEYVIGIFHHSQGSRTRAEKEQRDTMVWNIGAGIWSTPGDSVYAAQIRADVLDAQTNLRGNHVRNYVVMPMFKSTGSVCIKDGWYYLPASQTDKLLQAQQVLKGMESFKLCVAALQAGMGWEEPVSEECRESLTNELEALLEQIGGWETMASRVATSTQTHVMERFDALHAQAESYEAALSITLDDLRERIETMRGQAADVIEDREADAQGRGAERKAQKAAERKAQKEADQTGSIAKETSALEQMRQSTESLKQKAQDERNTLVANLKQRTDYDLDLLWETLCGDTDKPRIKSIMIEMLADEFAA